MGEDDLLSVRLGSRFLGNDGGGFVGIHGRLREIPEVVSARKPLRGNGR